LSAAAALRHRGIDAVVLEQDDAVGGTWARRYERLHLHTVRELSGLAHFPIPSTYSRYLSRDEVVRYLNEYARRFGLVVVTGTAVRHVRGTGNPKLPWRIETTTGPWRSRAVVVATGQYRQPRPPEWPGRASYQGTLMHSASYSNGAAFAGRRVLVVGAGNSGAEIATDLADSGASLVALSIRTPPPIVPRDPFGMPVQRTSLLLSSFPAAIANRLGRLTARLVLGDLTRHGMPAGRFAPYTTLQVPLIDVGFVHALKHGRVMLKPALDRLTTAGAVFADGSSEPFDAIVAATGYTTGLEALVEPAELLDAAGEPKGRSGEPTTRPGIYFIGFVHSLRGHLFEANLASRRLARNAEQYLASGS